jgi:hypothetical protein
MYKTKARAEADSINLKQSTIQIRVKFINEPARSGKMFNGKLHSRVFMKCFHLHPERVFRLKLDIYFLFMQVGLAYE